MPNVKQLLYSQTSVQMPIEKQLLNNPPDICSNACYKTHDCRYLFHAFFRTIVKWAADIGYNAVYRTIV